MAVHYEWTAEHRIGNPQMCECEHMTHFPYDSDSALSHAYGDSEASHAVTMDYGTFKFCPACVTAHSAYATRRERL